MNLLGHIYFSNEEHQLMYANLFGDFVKGKDLSHLPLRIEQGVYLHRMIDHYVDNHPAVLELLHILYEPLPKIAGIAVDLFFDHLLAKYWDRFHPEPLETFLNSFYKSEMHNEEHFTSEFRWMIREMKEKNWLHQYQFEYGLTKACEGVSERISFKNVLSSAPEVFKTYEKEVEKSFFAFMNDAIPHHKAFIEKMPRRKWAS